MDKLKIIAAVRNEKELMAAINSNVETIFMLAANISDLNRQVLLAHGKGKKVYVHLDLAEGIGKDEYGIRFIKEQGADGVISTRTNIIKMAKKEGISTVQRFFAVDSHSVDTIVETASLSKADMIEIMPGIAAKVIKRLKNELGISIVAGGLIESVDEIKDAILSGAEAISTGKIEFWGI